MIVENGKMPPQEVQVEKAILGAMLVDGDCVDVVFEIIKSASVFYKTEHKYIFEAIQVLAEKGSVITILSVAESLKKIKKFDTAGGDFYLIELTQVVGSTAGVELDCRVVLERWIKREMITSSSKVIQDSYDVSTDVFDLTAVAEKNLDAINEMINTGSRGVTMASLFEKQKARLEFLGNMEENEVSGVTTGFKKVDRFTGGWQPGDLIIIAARPGMGKTALILKNLLEISLRGDAVGMFSLEMGGEQLLSRLLAINSTFHLNQLRKIGFAKNEYWNEFYEKQESMSQLEIHIDDTASCSIQQLKMKARIMKRKHDIKALFVDYIQLMSGDGKSGNREQEISTISRGLKTLAKELQIPIIALSQLSRSVETRGGSKRPLLSDLRESGAIEQDADAVVFIFRPEYYGIEPEEDIASIGANSELIFAKYREGGLQTLGLYWDGNKTKFMDPEDNMQSFDSVANVEPGEAF